MAKRGERRHPELRSGQRVGAHLTSLTDTAPLPRSNSTRVHLRCDCGNEFSCGLYFALSRLDKPCKTCLAVTLPVIPIGGKIGDWHIAGEAPRQGNRRRIIIEHSCGWRRESPWRQHRARANFRGIRCSMCNSEPSVFARHLDRVCAWPVCIVPKKPGARMYVDHDHSCHGSLRACWRCVRGLVHVICNHEIAYCERLRGRIALPRIITDYLDNHRPLRTRGYALRVESKG